MNLVKVTNLKEVKILYSSGVAYLNKNKSKDSETDLTKKIIDGFSISKDRIIFLPDARNTMENFKRLNEFLIKKDKINSKILLITSASHMNRSMLIAKKFNLNIYSLPSDFTTKQDSTGLINSYQNLNFTNNLKKFDGFIKELISTAISRLL